MKTTIRAQGKVEKLAKEALRMPEKYSLRTRKSKILYERAKKVLPGGVSYGIRYFQPYPFFTARAKGSKLYDVDGNEYVDFWLGHTALILGHSPQAVVDAVKKQVENGTIYGTSHEMEVELAEQIARMVPSAEMTRFTNSGTEANMYAIRLARATMGKDKIAKFEGGWHGGYDALQKGVKYPYDMKESAGLTNGSINDTILLPYNDLDGVNAKLKDKEVASITIEPVLGGGGCIPADKEFLKGLRELCDERGILLIFDEVITGFRLAPGGGQQYFGVKPDISVFGKILGGGFPVGAFCAHKELMERIDSQKYKRPSYSFHGGTFAANPVTMTAGYTTLKLLENGMLIDKLNKLGEKVKKELQDIFENNRVEVQVTGMASLFNIHFTNSEIHNASDIAKANLKKLLNYNLVLIENGVFFLPTHSGALCTEHSEKDINKLLNQTEKHARQKA